ncbi:Signal transduction histidine kinase [Myxococcus hansupus]|uniref:Signal transduction histidine kinase n=1 Tax=Pseudomyxococcus hansupus TaxID=1297742 RepID=A0A0H4WYE3_9BACT|nr:Signal transduction histidine kinase [Myxococcus hansupus]
MFEHSRDGVLVLDAGQRIVEVNRAAERIFGPRSAYMGQPVAALLPGWRPPESRASADTALRETELAGQRPGGVGPAVYLRVLTLPISGEHETGWVLQLQDMTARLEVEASLRQQKEFFEAVVINSPVAIITITRQFRVLSWNPEATRLFGYTPAEALGKHIFDLVASEPSVLPRRSSRRGRSCCGGACTPSRGGCARMAAWWTWSCGHCPSPWAAGSSASSPSTTTSRTWSARARRLRRPIRPRASSWPR